MKTDIYIFFMIHGLLALTFLNSLVKDIWTAWAPSKVKNIGEVRRGESSRAWFLTSHAAVAALLLHAIDVADVATGHKLLVSVVDTAILLYLVFLSNHWQNKLIQLHNWWVHRVGPK